MSRRARIAALALGVVAIAGGVALARPGGGESYSGGGGHSSSSGSSGSSGGGGGDWSGVFELIYWLIRLCIYEPRIGLPVVGGGIIFLAYAAFRSRANKDWDSGLPVAVQRNIGMNVVRRLDPDFSQVLFEDFAFRLFATAQRVRATAQGLATIAPYVAAAARQQLASREPVGALVEQVVVGALRVVDVDLPGSGTYADASLVRVRVEYEANVATAAHTAFSIETWRFARDPNRRTKPPASRDFPCPSCGAPWQASATGTQQCASCGQVVDNGRFDWIVEQISVASIDERPPTLTTEVRERGTDLPTYRADDVLAKMGELTAADPAVTHDAVHARLQLIYDQLDTAWAKNDLAPVRGLVSDGLYDYLQYWIDAYKRQGLRNELADMKLGRSELAKVVRDRWYDAITLRIWGTGKDYVVRTADGKVVRGSKRRDRAYSEYWTLVRAAGRKGAPRATPVCSHCGAPLAITMAGACEHCGVHVTAGEFDWVLSKIEQDDSYRG